MTEPYKTEDEIESVAIIGLSGRFPGADSVHEFWQNLCDGVESITFFGPEELDPSIPPFILYNPNYVHAKPMLRDIETFDAGFFSIPPREAELIDPQQRLFLECCWEALEDATYDPETYPGWISAFGGIAVTDYYHVNLRSNADLLSTIVGGLYQVSLANEHDYLATRVSYRLNLKGASFDLQCACSTSLVATHLACLSLLSYHCDMALAGGVSIRFPKKTGYLYEEGSIKSPNGHCRPFDANARGTVFGDGVGVVALKRTSEALRDGDHIYAIIKGIAVSNDGAAKVGFTAPGVDGQKRAISMALQVADVHPETISYVEAHATGTELGDPVEMEALTQAFRARTDRKQFCAIGSVKGNVGHLDRAAGITGLIKATLAVKHRTIPPSINCDVLNPKIDFENSPFFVNTVLREWKAADGQPLRAGVSAFGVGGTNVHAILEQAPTPHPSTPSRPFQLLLLSARTENALENTTDNLLSHLDANPDLDLADAAYTLQVGRRAFEMRRALVCQTVDDAVAALRERDPAHLMTQTWVGSDRPVAFMFSGQGAQYVNMGRDLYLHEPTFRELIDTCSDILEAHLDLDLRHLLYPDDALAQQATEQLGQTRLTQPALFAVEYALARLWISWGITPTAMIGHSIGEYVAACTAGVFALDDALALVAARGSLMQSMPSGAMLSLPLSEADALPLLDDSLTVATINGPQRCTVSGPTAAVAALENQLSDQGVAVRLLHTSHAFHSSMMDPILEPFEKQVRQVELGEPQIPFLSNVTGTWITPQQATDPAYWARHIRQPVRFSDGLSALAQIPEQVLLEIGPGHTLRTLAQRHPDRDPQQVALSSIRHPKEQDDDVALLLRTLGRLWLAGVAVDWPAFYQNERRLRLPLPTYPFDRQRYYFDVRTDGLAQSAPLVKSPDVTDWFYIPSWKHTMPLTLRQGKSEGHCLLFGDRDSLCEKLAQQFQARGYSVTTTLPGEQFSADGDTFTIHPARREDYDALFIALADRDLPPTHLVHLWNVPPIDTTAPDFTERALHRSFYSLLFLAQTISDHDPTSDLTLAVVSSNMQQVADEEIVHPEKAALLGPCQVIHREMPNVATRSVDVPLPEAGSTQEARLVDRLIAEVETPTPDTIVAYRGRNRLVRTYEQAPLAESSSEDNHRLREGGVYLITGGLGGIGLTLAQDLARTAHANLVLTSRSRFPEPDTWDQWLATHDARDRTSLRIQTVRRLRELAADVMIVQADVADPAQMEAAVQAARDRFGSIHGVVHAAGIPGGGVIQMKTPEAAAAVLRPKIQGARALASALRDLPLDFCLLCSSIASTLGEAGQVDYCAANAFLDAFSHASDDHGHEMTVAVNWDAWAQVGMAVNTATTYSTTRQQQAPETHPVDHPLLTSAYQDPNERIVYQMQLSPDEHWVLSEHIIMGIPGLPGTTFLELARAALADHAQTGRVEIREAMFLTPLRVARGDVKETQLVLEEHDGSFEFQVKSKAGVSAGGEVLWQAHAVGQVGLVETDAAAPRCDLDAIRARCPSELEITDQQLDAFLATSEEWIAYGPRWRSPRHASFSDDEVLVSLELDEPFRPDLDAFKLHPALLDVATSFATVILPNVDQNYLPLAYKNVRIYDVLPARLYSHLRLAPDSRIGGETMTFHVRLSDEQGHVLVDVEEFTLRLVEEAAASRLRDSSGEDDSATPAAPQRYDLFDAILPEEGVEAFHRILAFSRLPQVAVATRHLPTMIRQADELTEERASPSADRARASLAKHPRPALPVAFVAPRNEAETQIADIWRNLLGLEEIGVDDNFFDLGGDSLLMTNVYSKLRETFEQEISLVDLYTYPTIGTLSVHLEAETSEQDELSLEATQEWGQKYRQAMDKQRWQRQGEQ